MYDKIWNEYADGKNWLTKNLHRLSDKVKIWEKPGDLADIPIINSDPAIYTDLSSSSYPYVNGIYWKIANLRLTYHLPEFWLNMLKIKEASLSFVCDNLYTLTSKRFLGIDPENSSGWGAPRRFIVGLNVNF